MSGLFSSVSWRRLAAGVAAVTLLSGLGGCSHLPMSGGYDGLLSRPSFARTGEGSAAGNFLAARYAGSQRDAKAAAVFFARALEADPDNEAILESAFLLELSAGNVENSAKLAERIIAIDPGARMARLVRAVQLLHDQKYAEAGAELDIVPPRSLADVVWVSQRAWAHAGAGETDKAIALLSQPEVVNAVGAFGAYHRALVLDLAGREAEAAKAYAEAYEAVSGQSVRLVEAYGNFQLRGGRAEEALTLYGTFLSEHGSYPTILKAREAALAGGQGGTRMIATATDGAAEALFGIAGALAGEGVVEVPVTYLQLALYLRPQLDAGWALMGEFREEQGQWEEAARMFAKVDPQSPLGPSAAISIARNLSRLDRTDEAVKLLRRQLARDPDNTETMVALADQMRILEEFGDAAALYGRALANSGGAQPHNWQILYAEGISLERAGKWAEAEPLFQKALELQPDEPQVLNYLGYSWIDRGENLDQALEMIYKAVDQRPNDGYIVDSLGWAYFKLGDFETATYYLERAVELRPEDPTINDHLGDAYWHVGRFDEARFQWSHALTFAPEGDIQLRKALKAKLKDGLPQAAPIIKDGV